MSVYLQGEYMNIKLNIVLEIVNESKLTWIFKEVSGKPHDLPVRLKVWKVRCDKVYQKTVTRGKNKTFMFPSH